MAATSLSLHRDGKPKPGYPQRRRRPRNFTSNGRKLIMKTRSGRH